MSMSKVVGLLLATVALVMAVMVGRWSARPAEPAAPPAQAPVAAPSPGAARPAAASGPGAEASWSTSPWDQPATPLAGADTVTPAVPKADAERARALERIAERLEAQRRSGRPDPVEIDKALAEMERVNGGSRIAGLDLSALRANLRVVARMQELSREMEQLKPTAGELKDADRVRLMEKSKEIRALAAEMRSGAAMPAPSTTSGAVSRGTPP